MVKLSSVDRAIEAVWKQVSFNNEVETGGGGSEVQSISSGGR